VAEVDGQHVHGNPAHGATAHTFHQYRSAIGSNARVAIGIATGDDADAHRLVGLEVQPITHGVTRL